jgi:hypothetical protein
MMEEGLISGQDVHASNRTSSHGSQQHALIQQIRRRYNQEAVSGRTVEDDQAIRQLVE